MRMLDLIEKKKFGGEHNAEELAWLIQSVTDGSLSDEQLAAWLMAVRFQGMTSKETALLTEYMQHSGETADLSAISAPCVDKHSTGGVADTTTLVLVPLVAACGAHVAKMSGRGLGFTGGTLDKLESIPGFRIEQSIEEMIRQVSSIGCAVVAQTGELAPADKKLYALRDITSTTDSLPLIASSIMSKKLASGAAGIVLDVKSGTGALMPTLDSSIDLARAMVDIATHAGRKCAALVTDMNQPLGTHVGNALEVKEAIDVLAGRVRGELLDLALLLGAEMLVMAGAAADSDAARAALEKALRDGSGLEKFRQMIAAQGGDARVVDQPELLPSAAHKTSIIAEKDGYVSAMDAANIGRAAQLLGAGRATKHDVIDPAVGLILHKRVGDPIRIGETLCTLHVNDRSNEKAATSLVLSSVHCAAEKPAPLPLYYAIVRPDGTERMA